MSIMRGLVVLLAVCFAGCGPGIDPNLCVRCSKLAELESSKADFAAERRRDLREERDKSFSGLESFNRLTNKPGPLHFDCPECTKAYDLYLRATR